MKNNFRLFRSLSLFAVMAFLVISCGGGGGGGGDGVEDKFTVPDSFTGETTQAAINEGNGEDIVNAAYYGMLVGPDVLDLIWLLDDQVVWAAPVLGECGGTASYNPVSEDGTGSFSGELIFNDYCDGGKIINGTLPLSGTEDLNTGNLERLSLTFDNLGVDEITTSLTAVEGSLTWTQSEDMSSQTITQNLVIRDNDSQETFWVKDCNLQIDSGTPEDLVTLTYRFYHHVYGFVDVTTETTVLSGDTESPTGGTLLFTGAESQARLTFNSDQSTLLEIDADNDGVFEFTILPDNGGEDQISQEIEGEFVLVKYYVTPIDPVPYYIRAIKTDNLELILLEARGTELVNGESQLMEMNYGENGFLVSITAYVMDLDFIIEVENGSLVGEKYEDVHLVEASKTVRVAYSGERIRITGNIKDDFRLGFEGVRVFAVSTIEKI